jgi:aryl-alcohol dehydrogenase-like predicted oxidoreductase
MDEPGIKGYLSPDNLERLRRCEILAEEKGVTVPEIAMAWLFDQPDLSVFAVSGSSNPDRMRTNIAAAKIGLTAEERAWLNLEA